MSAPENAHDATRPSRQLLCSEACLFDLYLEADGTFVMQAEVNRAASFSIKFRLSDDEAAQFRREGVPFARTLALRVDSFPDHFAGRAI